MVQPHLEKIGRNAQKVLLMTKTWLRVKAFKIAERRNKQTKKKLPHISLR